MKMQKMLKRAAAAASGVIVLSSATSMATADSSATEEKTAVTATAAESTTAAETEAASAETVDKADNEQKMPEDWAKADVSDYDSSLTLISYEIATPEMAKVGGTVDPLAGLSEEERKALEETIAKKKSAPAEPGRGILCLVRVPHCLSQIKKNGLNPFFFICW